MELPLQPKLDEYVTRQEAGFNPCFNGTTSATVEEDILSTLEMRFQSLF